MGSQAPQPSSVADIRRRIRVALGEEPGDLMLDGGNVVNVFTGKVEPANIVIAGEWIAGVGPHVWRAKRTIPLDGAFVLPGLIDAHIHVESTLLMPGQLARLIVPRGTTTLVADPHELANVLGVRGIELLANASRHLPFDLFCMASSCVPAVSWDDAGAVLGPSEVTSLLDRPYVLGLAEVMDIPAVLHAEERVLKKIHEASVRRRVVDGHAPHLSGLALQAYVAAGIRSDHESTTQEEARAKAALGMLVQVREGSAEHNLDDLLPAIVAGDLGDWCLASDDVLPTDLRARGHIDHLLKRVVAGGVVASEAVRHATLIPARHYGLTDRGAIAPGYRADLVVVSDLGDFSVSHVIKNGALVAQQGRLLDTPGESHRQSWENTIRPGPVTEDSFVLNVSSSNVPVICLVQGQIVTRKARMEISVANGRWVFRADQDVQLAASIERHRGSGRIGLGLVSGFRLRKGALGSSVAHDSHNLIVVGTNSKDMYLCVRALERMGGGFVVACDGDVIAELPLPVAGLLADDDVDVVCQRLAAVDAAARELGFPWEAPFGYLSFLALPVIPELRITDQGLFDVTSQQFLAL